MQQDRKSNILQIQTFDGPNVWWPQPAILGKFDCSEMIALPMQKLILSTKETASRYLPTVSLSSLTDTDCNHPAVLIAQLTMSIQSCKGSLDLKTSTRIINDNIGIAVIEYYSRRAGESALKLAFELVCHALGETPADDASLHQRARQTLELQRLQPKQTSALILKAARNMNIPFYPLADACTHIVYGQGSKSRIFTGAATEHDSAFGTIIQHNKADTSHFIAMIGYPVPEQALARDYNEALKLADRIGFPVVIKPQGEGQGFGVTADIRTPKTIAAAFRLAKSYSPNSVIVEKHIPGFDHRITVSSGRVIGAICRVPAKVTGNGLSTVEELIEEENRQRPEEQKRLGILKDIVIDESLIQALENEALTISSIPEAGRTVYLRTNANISTGGTFFDVIGQIHPDNLQMAEDIARNLRLDSVGIDFITRDIKQSWRQEGAIIEVNTTPGLLEELAFEVLINKFGKPADARIPTRLLIGDSCQAEHSQPGEAFVGESGSRMGSQARNFKGRSLYQMCMALLTDPCCKKITVSMNLDSLIQHGLPIDYFDDCQIDMDSASGKSLSVDNRKTRLINRLLSRHTGKITRISGQSYNRVSG